MFKANSSFGDLDNNYLFSEIARRVSAFQEANPGADIIRMGIGDVTRPICPAAVSAIHRAADDLASAATFHGYGPEQGYPFLREAIARHDYRERGVAIDPDEIFVSDGAKSDTGNIVDLFDASTRVAVTDPAYPVYVDTNVMAGRLGAIEYLRCVEANGFMPPLPATDPGVIYLCYPNNPTGVAMDRAAMKLRVDYALAHKALILYDSAYEAYIRPDNNDIPHSIYEIEGATQCAVEFRSFSKTAGFTGVRCGYTVVPRALKVAAGADGAEVSLRDMWLRRQCTKFNGASYISQRAAEALYTPEGRAQVRATIDGYMANARMLREKLREAGYSVWGGVDSPYVWVRTPEGMTSWEFFDFLLSRINLVVTPGSGFGSAGEGYVRLTAFNTPEATAEACRRLATL